MTTSKQVNRVDTYIRNFTVLMSVLCRTGFPVARMFHELCCFLFADDNDREPIGNVNIYGRLTTLEHKVS